MTSTGFFFLAMAILTFFYVVASIRTNIVLVLVLLFIDLAFSMLTSTYWNLADGKTAEAENLQLVSLPFTTRSGSRADPLFKGGWRLDLHILHLRFVLGTVTDPCVGGLPI